ncbi:hypothetical protein [Arthrobacter sp. JCM 19049]|uniref:hypothetical protein n=1 Tax=Arthrobacter sp. JCM 19049 TaxID=1460643 RepID=UPI002436F6B1|nr:hypothetical protein [Arthrobacter sp. JCM 19049]
MQIDISAQRPGNRYPVEVALVGDAALSLERLQQLITRRAGQRAPGGNGSRNTCATGMRCAASGPRCPPGRSTPNWWCANWANTCRTTPSWPWTWEAACTGTPGS